MPLHGYPEMEHLPESCSVVIPVYNSEESLEQLVTRLKGVIPALFATYEIILVNDGSKDRSWQVIRALSQQHPELVGVNLMRNQGQHNAVLCGIRAARHAVIITLDDDLQNPPEEIPKLLEEFKKGYDVVYGTPRELRHGFRRNLASRTIKYTLRLAMGDDIGLRVAAFRLFRTQLREAFADYHSPYVSIDVLLSWGTTRFSWVYVDLVERAAGASNYTFRKLASLAITMLTSFSVLPLRLASIMGFIFTIIGFLILLYVLVSFVIYGGSVPGFPFLASMVAIFSGVQLFSLGIMGEYLARIYMRAMNRPSYVIRERTDE